MKKDQVSVNHHCLFIHDPFDGKQVCESGSGYLISGIPNGLYTITPIYDESEILRIEITSSNLATITEIILGKTKEGE